MRAEFTYDDADNLTSMTDKKTVDGQDVIYRYTGYGYDGFNRLTWVSECDTSSVPTEAVIEANKISYQYDGKDRLTAIDYPDSALGVTGLRFTYNVYGWLTEVKAARESGGDRTIREYAYTDDGKVESMTFLLYTSTLIRTDREIRNSICRKHCRRIPQYFWRRTLTG